MTRRSRIALTGLALALTVLLCGSCRERLWVHAGQFHQVTLETDWSQYGRPAPDGMTAYFFPLDFEHASYHTTTAEVLSTQLYLPHGHYSGVVIDYSPIEYVNQRFVDMDNWDLARAEATPLPVQPADAEAEELYGPNCYHEPLTKYIREDSPNYTVVFAPEWMALDTMDIHVNTGKYRDYVPYELRETYPQTLEPQTFNAQPVPVIQQLKLRVYVKGIYYLYNTKASLAGLSDGRYLTRNVTTDYPCVFPVEDWTMDYTGDNEGYVCTTVNTFGLRSSQEPVKAETVLPTDIRLNLFFLLRDQETVLAFHYDIGDHIYTTDNELVLELVLNPEDFDYPVLPYVVPKGGAGFDADVVPWEPGDDKDIVM